MDVSAIVLGALVPAKLALRLYHNVAYESIYWITTVVFAADAAINYERHRREDRDSTFGASGNRTAWFVVDVVAALPFGFALGGAWFDMLRLVKLARVGRTMAEVRERTLRYGDYFKLGFFAVWYMLVVHWLACGWSVVHPEPDVVDKFSHYLHSLYWSIVTVATVGYGDITPENDLQMMFAMGLMAFGVALYGTVIGNIASLLSTKDPAKALYLGNMDRLKAIVQQRRLPFDLQSRIQDYFTYLYRKRWGLNETDFVDSLPPGLRTDVSLFFKREAVEKIPLFQNASDEFLRAVALELKPQVFTPGDYVFRKGDEGDEMFFVVKGELNVLIEDEGEPIATLKDGDFFGEIALFKDVSRTATIRAVKYSDLYSLDKGAFNYVLKRFPQFSDAIREMAEKRLEGLD